MVRVRCDRNESNRTSRHNACVIIFCLIGHDHAHDLGKSPSLEDPISLTVTMCNQKQKMKCIWRPNPYVFRTLGLRPHESRCRYILGHSKVGNELATPSLCGVTFGVGPIFGFTNSARNNRSTIKPKTDSIGDNEKHCDDAQSDKVDTLITVANGREKNGVGNCESHRESIISHLDEKHWTEIDASCFKIRSQKYMSDKSKTPSSPNLFRLITVDCIQASEPIMKGFCSHPKERVRGCCGVLYLQAVVKMYNSFSLSFTLSF